MGILDDAIREHLELKRSHGASDDEIRRKEAEAFGPARQEVATDASALDEHTELLPPDDAAAVGEPHDASPGDLDPAQAVPDDPYAVHPGDHPVPDTHDHLHPAGSDPAWGDDTELFAEPPAGGAAPPAADAGAGTLERGDVEPGPPTPPDHPRDEQHPALVHHAHIGGEEHPPEPVFRHTAATPAAPVEPAPVEEPPVEEPPIEEPPVEEPPVSDVEGDEGVLEETPEFLQDAPEHDRLWFEQKPPRDFDFG